MTNKLFIIIVFIIFALQLLLISVSGKAFQVHPAGLTYQHWFMCVGIGSISLVVSFMLKLVNLGSEESESENKEEAGKE